MFLALLILICAFFKIKHKRNLTLTNTEKLNFKKWFKSFKTTNQVIKIK